MDNNKNNYSATLLHAAQNGYVDRAKVGISTRVAQFTLED